MWPREESRVAPNSSPDDGVGSFEPALGQSRPAAHVVRPEARPGAGSGCQVHVILMALAMVILLWVRAAICQGGGGGGFGPLNGSELNLDGRGLREVPLGELCSVMANQSEQINVLSLANNRITRLHLNGFQCGPARLTALRILNLRNNEIEIIGDGAFTGLESVQVLLLDNNRLRAVPARDSLRPLKSLRHLNLANNKIEFLDEESFGAENANLISLNLNGNPLRLVAPNSLLHLARLKTLTMSQSALSGHLAVLSGLAELRFYHLDRGADLRSVPANLCQSSRKLSSLVLKSNQLEQVPPFEHCQSLLLLDLSYNRIRGRLSANFTRQPNLIDLYLGHNQIESIEADAFVGLDRLQVLSLNNNHLKRIHPGAFLPLRRTLHELNLSNNNQLAALSSMGLDQLASLKAYGNQQLRSLPHLKSASLLALTYAYHCCDYLPNDGRHSSRGESLAADDQESTLIMQLLSSAFSNIRQLIPGQQQHYAEPEEERAKKVSPPDNDTSNLAEVILWPDGREQAAAAAAAKLGGRSAGQDASVIKLQAVDGVQMERRRQDTLGLDFDLWQTVEVIDEKIDAEPTLQPEPNPQSAATNSSSGRLREAGSSGNLRRRRRGHQPQAAPANYDALLIDELLEEAKQIRLDHSVGLVNQIWRPRSIDGGGGGEVRETTSSAATLMEQDSQSNSERNIIKFWAKHLVVAPPADGSEDGDDDDVIMDLDGEYKLSHWQARDVVLDENLAARMLARMLAHKRRHLGRRDAPLPRPLGDQLETQPAAVQCLPKPSPFFPCRDLFDTWWLRAGVWGVFLLAFTGNILVIVVLGSVRQSSSSSALTNIMWLAHSKRHIDVPRFLVINLAVADLIMALYLGILAFVDLSTLGEFRMFAIKWQYSNGCKLAGFLGVLSSELSIFILAIITLERNYAITNAVHLNRRLSLHKAMVIMFVGYMFAVVMALLPLNGISDYRKFSICLPLDMDSNFYSHIYVITLVCINSFSFLLLLSCYLRMYCAIRGSQAWNTNDLRIAKRMSILVITDFLCWMPIIVVAMASLFGHHIIGPNGIKILTIFILPLNSVANPFLYAITTKKFKRDLSTLLHRLRSMISCLMCSTGPNLKDSSAYSGYNHYQRNMMIMVDKNKRNPTKGEHQSTSGRHQANGGAFGRRHMTKTAAAQTAILNRATCSCRRLEIQHTTSEGALVNNLHLPPLQQPIPLLNEPVASQTHQVDSDVCTLEHNVITCVAQSPDQLAHILVADSGLQARPKSHPNSEVIVCTVEPEDGHTNSRVLVSSMTLPVQLDGQAGSSSPLHGPKEVRQDFEPQRHLLSVSIQQTNRSASACGFSGGSERNPSSEHPEARASGSCDMVRAAGEGNSLEKLSRSINRLLFNPVAKAWSSIQISLNTSANGNAANKTNILSEEKSGSNNKSIDDDDQLMQDSTTMDDLLMASTSPPSSRQLFRNNERRMSRSCDYIKYQPSPSSVIMSPTSSSHEATTSQGDYDDDQRILLATIDRLAANKHGRISKAAPFNENRLYEHNRCTRCRSWSPALLGKLEDCIYQIKCRIPGLRREVDDNRCQESVERDICPSPGGYSCTAERQINNIRNIEQSDTDEDRFDANTGFGETVGRNRRRLSRLRQQSSATSDSLSTRTGATIVTNISSSFDSTSNIPSQVGQRTKETERDDK